MLILDSISTSTTAPASSSAPQQHSPSLDDNIAMVTTKPTDDDDINALKMERDRLRTELEKIRKLLILSTKNKHLSWLLNSESAIKTSSLASDPTQNQSFSEVKIFFFALFFIEHLTQ